jgi:endonuclease/exonuclease/phosphatase (EEP) superfamily protein YafD
MPKITLCTANVENLYGRYKVFGYLPNDRFKRWVMTPEELLEKGGFHPGEYSSKNAFTVFDKEGWRTATAKALKGTTEDYPDIAVLMEIEDMRALRKFNVDYLGCAYPHALLIDSHDPRLIDIGILSKHPIVDVKTHMDEPYGDASRHLFSRDCVEATFDVDGAELTVFANHLKSKLAESPEELLAANKKRKAQAERVAAIARERFGPGLDGAKFAIVGDFNDTPDSPYVAPLVEGLGLESAVDRIADPKERWTHLWKSEYAVSQIDYILLSPRLAADSPSPPRIERRGISTKCKTVRFEGASSNRIPLDFERFPEVSGKIEASDHCPLFQELNV